MALVEESCDMVSLCSHEEDTGEPIQCRYSLTEVEENYMVVVWQI